MSHDDDDDDLVRQMETHLNDTRAASAASGAASGAAAPGAASAAGTTTGTGGLGGWFRGFAGAAASATSMNLSQENEEARRTADAAAESGGYRRTLPGFGAAGQTPHAADDEVEQDDEGMFDEHEQYYGGEDDYAPISLDDHLSATNRTTNARTSAMYSSARYGLTTSGGDSSFSSSAYSGVASAHAGAGGRMEEVSLGRPSARALVSSKSTGRAADDDDHHLSPRSQLPGYHSDSSGDDDYVVPSKASYYQRQMEMFEEEEHDDGVIMEPDLMVEDDDNEEQDHYDGGSGTRRGSRPTSRAGSSQSSSVNPSPLGGLLGGIFGGGAQGQQQGQQGQQHGEQHRSSRTDDGPPVTMTGRAGLLANLPGYAGAAATATAVASSIRSRSSSMESLKSSHSHSHNQTGSGSQQSSLNSLNYGPVVFEAPLNDTEEYDVYKEEPKAYSKGRQRMKRRGGGSAGGSGSSVGSGSISSGDEYGVGGGGGTASDGESGEDYKDYLQAAADATDDLLRKKRRGGLKRAGGSSSDFSIESIDSDLGEAAAMATAVAQRQHRREQFQQQQQQQEQQGEAGNGAGGGSPLEQHLAAGGADVVAEYDVQRLDSRSDDNRSTNSVGLYTYGSMSDTDASSYGGGSSHRSPYDGEDESDHSAASPKRADGMSRYVTDHDGTDGAALPTLSSLTGRVAKGGDGADASSSARSFGSNLPITRVKHGYTGQDIDSSRKLNVLESGGKFELDDMSNSQASKEFLRAREQERERLERQRERRERRERKAREKTDEEGDSCESRGDTVAANSGPIQGMEALQSLTRVDSGGHLEELKEVESQSQHDAEDDMMEEELSDHMKGLDDYANPPLHQEEAIMAAEATKLRQELEMELDREEEEEEEANEVDSVDQSAAMSVDQGSQEDVHENAHQSTGSPEPGVSDAPEKEKDEELLAPAAASSNALSGDESSISDRRNIFAAAKYSSAGSAEADITPNDAVPTTSQGTHDNMDTFDALAGMDGLNNRWSSPAFLDAGFGGSEFGISSRWGAAAEESRAVYEEREQSRKSLMVDVNTSGASASTSAGVLRGSRTSSMAVPALIGEEKGEDDDDEPETNESGRSAAAPSNDSDEVVSAQESSDGEDGVIAGAVAATAAAAVVGLGAWFGRKQEEPAPLVEDNDAEDAQSIPDSSAASDAPSVNPEIMHLYEVGVISKAEMEQMVSADRQFGQKIDADSSHGGDEGDDFGGDFNDFDDHAASSKDDIIASAAQEEAKAHEDSSADEPVEEDGSSVDKALDQSVSDVLGAAEQDVAMEENDDPNDSSRQASIEIDIAQSVKEETSLPSGEQSDPSESTKNDDQDQNDGIITSEESVQARFDSSRESLMESIIRLDETTQASMREYHHDVARSNDDDAGSRRSSAASSKSRSSSEERQAGESLREFWSRRRRGKGSDHSSEDSGYGSASSHTKNEDVAVKPAVPIVAADENESVLSEESGDAMATMITAAAATALVAGGVGVAVASASPDGEPEPSASEPSDTEPDDKGASGEEASEEASVEASAEPSEESSVDVSACDSTDFPQYDGPPTDGGDDMLEPLSDAEPMDDYFGEEPLSEEEGDDYYVGYNDNTGSMSESSEDVLDTVLAKDHAAEDLPPVTEYEDYEDSYSQSRNQSHEESAYEESPDAATGVQDRAHDDYNRDAGSLSEEEEEEVAQHDDYTESQEPNAKEQMSTPHHSDESLKGSSASPEDQSEFEHQDYASPLMMQEESPGSYSEEEEGQFEYTEAAPRHFLPHDANNRPRDMTEEYSESLKDDDSYQYEQYSAPLKGSDSYQEEEEFSESLKGDSSSNQRGQNSDSPKGESGDSSVAIGDSTSYQQAEYSSSSGRIEGSANDDVEEVDEAKGQNSDSPKGESGDSSVAIGDSTSYQQAEYSSSSGRIEGSANDDVEEVDEAKGDLDLTPSQEAESYGYDRSHEDEYDNLEPPRLPSHGLDEPPSQESFSSSVSSVTMLTLEDDPQRKAEVVERKRQERLAALAAAGIAAGAVAAGAVAEADQREAAGLAVEQAAAREAEDTQNSWELRPETAEDLFDGEEQLQREMDEYRERRQREEKARKIARRSLSRPQKAGKSGRVYGNDSLADLEASIKELRAAFNAPVEKTSAAKRRSARASRKSVRSLIKDENDSEIERMEADEKREKANAVNVVLIGFEGLLEVLLKVSDELVLSSTFRSSRLAPDVLNTEALLSLLSYTSSIDVAFSEMQASLLDLYPDGHRLEGTADGECIARITKLTSFITAIIKRVTERQEFNAKSATCYVTMLELLQRASGELKYIVNGDEQKEFEVTPQLQRAWTSSGHEAQVRMLEDGPKEDDYYFKLLAMNVVAQMDEWAPSQDDLRFVCCYDISPDEESGFYSSKMADIPQGATDVLDRIRGNPLPRDDVVSWVLRRLLPSPSDQSSSLSSSSFLDDNTSVLSSGMSLASGTSSRGRRARGGNIVSLTAAPEDPYDPNSLAFGGVGKSTIAALVATKEQVRKEYNAGIVWIDVGNRGAYGFTYDEYCDVLMSMCLQLKLKDQPNFSELVNVPGESRIELERRESKMMLEARDKVSGLIRGRRGALLLILDDVWRNQDLELFRFKWKKKKICDILVTTRVQGLLASDFVNIDFLSLDEGIQLLLAEAGQSPDHVMATSVEAKAIVRECANHPIATKIVARWLGLKHATAGVINSVEEIHDDVAKALERVSVDASSSTGSFGVAGDMLYEILDQSLAPTVDGKTTNAIKLCFAAFVLVFCKYSPTTGGRPTIPSGAVAELFEAVLHTKETDLFGDGSVFEQHFRRATQLIPEALAALGVMTVEKDASSNEEDSTTLQLKHDIMLEYGDYLLSPEGGLGNLVQNAELVWNRAFASSYLEDMVGNSSWDVTKPNPGRKYALEFLVNHLIRAEMIQEAAVLLRDERFVKGRLLALGMNKGTKKHVQDCEETFDLLLDITSTTTEPGDFISRAYEKCGAVISTHLSSSHASDSAASRQETVDAGLAYNAMGFSLAERNRWLDATYHYNRSYELLDMALGDDEVVASILFNRALVYHETNQYEKSMESLDECLNQRTAIYGEQGPLVAQTICQKGLTFAAMSDYAAAMYNYRKALDIYQVEPNRNRVEIGNTFQSMGRMHREKGELNQALKLYSEALRCKKIEVGLNHQDLASVYIEMGYCHAEKNDREAAEPIFDEALRLMEQAEPTDENKAELLAIQGIMHNMADEQDEGLECYEQALDNLKTKCPQKKGKIATLLNLIANEYVARGENRRAFKLFEESLKCRKEMVGFVHVDVATTLVDMATLHQQREKWEKALRCLEEALRIRKLRLGDSEKVAQTLELIGNLSKEIGQLNKAEMAYEDALRILRGLHGDDHVSVANILHEMGDLMDDISEYDEAINNFSECLEIRKRALGYDHEDVAETLYSMAFALHNQGEHEEALDCLDDALQVRRQRFGADHELCGDCLNIMGFIESKKGEHEIALDLLDEALEIRQNNGSTLKAADTMKNIGNIHKDRKEYAAALDCFEDCLKWRKRELGLNDERVADAQLALGNVYSEMDENEEAMHCFTEALKVRRVVHGSHDDRVASVLQTMGIIEFRAGNLARGREYLEDFVRIRKNNHTNESADYVNVLFIIGNIHKIEGHDSDAKRAWAEAYDIFNAIGLQEENPQIAKVLTKLLNKKDKHGDGASESKKSVFGRLKSNFSNEKVIKPTKKQPMSDVSGSGRFSAGSARRLVIE